MEAQRCGWTHGPFPATLKEVMKSTTVHQNNQHTPCHIIQHDTYETTLTTTMARPLWWENARVFIYIRQPPRLSVSCVRRVVVFEVAAGAAVMPRPAQGAWREAAILAAPVVQDTWAESDTECLIRESFGSLLAERDELTAALWLFYLMQRVVHRYLNLKSFELEPSFACHKDVS